MSTAGLAPTDYGPHPSILAGLRLCNVGAQRVVGLGLAKFGGLVEDDKDLP